ncbi:MAG: 3-hydroxyacyl-CoA dehydrogenase NAD-binding domain-containing protein [Planctomycetaceae bacterium]|nr:3-hydroxyacyl-CoA dehydrogenase NAD-binding domain-containing protein [Planctomycetaceae bacterium]
MLIGISGAGAMGSTIALAFAQAGGHNIVLSSSTEEFAASGKAKIAAKLKKLAEKGKITQEAADEILGRIETGPKEKLAPCDLVMESTSEDMTKKKNLFLSLQEICKPDVIFATNTSSLSITEMALGIDRPVVGMHFFNPADMMKLVEIIPGMNTPPEVVEKVTALAKEIGKTPVQVQEAGGFVVNRILIPMINEAVGIYAEGLATAEDIDTAMKLGANHPIGPLALGDLVGLDVCLAIMEVLQAEFGEDKYRPHPLLRKMVRGGRLGRKSGRGFFDYGK